MTGVENKAGRKAFLNAYVQTLARDLATSGIVVSAVLPGAIYSKGGHWDIVKKSIRGNLNTRLEKLDTSIVLIKGSG